MKEGDLLLQVGLGGSLHLPPGRFTGRNSYLRTIHMLLVRWRKLCHCTRPRLLFKFPLIHLLHVFL